jgi:hypothetical protein
MRTLPESRKYLGRTGAIPGTGSVNGSLRLNAANDNVTREVRIGDCLLLQGDAFLMMPACGEVDCIVTDPPYNEKTHKGARSAKSLGASRIDFDSLSD